MIKRTLIFIFIVISQVSSAWGGPYEDALAALDRGDYKTAIEILKVIAERGNAGAQAMLAFTYDLGHGVPQDIDEAVKWYRLAAAQGERSAQYNLGGLYSVGQGVPVDYVRAYMWLDLNVGSGNKSSIEERDELAKRMSPEQLSQAKKMAEDCLEDKPRLCD